MNRKSVLVWIAALAMFAASFLFREQTLSSTQAQTTADSQDLRNSDPTEQRANESAQDESLAIESLTLDGIPVADFLKQERERISNDLARRRAEWPAKLKQWEPLRVASIENGHADEEPAETPVGQMVRYLRENGLNHPDWKAELEAAFRKESMNFDRCHLVGWTIMVDKVADQGNETREVAVRIYPTLLHEALTAVRGPVAHERWLISPTEVRRIETAGFRVSNIAMRESLADDHGGAALLQILGHAQ